MRILLSATSAAFLLFAFAGAGRADDQVDLQKVIDNAIKAQGGAENLNKYKAVTLKMKGKFYMGEEGTDFTGELATQEPGKSRIDLSFEIMGKQAKFIQVFDGAKGWKQVKLGDMTVVDEELNKESVAEAKESDYAGSVGRLVVLKKKGFKLEPLGEVKVGDKPAIGVRVTHKGHRDISLFFDKKTGLMVKSERVIKDPDQGGDTEITQAELYEDYKDVKGVKHAHKLTITRDGKKHVDAEITEVKPAEKLDENIFSKP
jgi:hypothetical protein